MTENTNNSSIAPTISLRGIRKYFADNAVLKGINLDLYPAEVVAVIGGNGAGKSTLMKILMGIYQPDGGTIRIGEQDVALTNPTISLAHGIYYVPQEPLLFPNMTVEENVLIGFPDNHTLLKSKLRKLIADLGWKIPLDMKGAMLSIAEQQLVEILRGLMREVKTLILDEPTSALTFHEIKSLFLMINGLKEQGISLIYITHRLTEVFEIATRVVILRDGQITVDGPVASFTKEMLIQGLLPPSCGASQTDCCYFQRKNEIDRNVPMLTVDYLCGNGFKDICFEIYPGEIFGIAGVVGAGRTELAISIFGLDRITSGSVRLLDRDVTGIPESEIIAAGINYVPEDRYVNGIYKIADVSTNLTSALIRKMKFLLNHSHEKEVTQKYVDDFLIKITGQDQLLSALSGGNQQKVVLGRALSTKPKVVILDEPTRGIDANARGDVYRIIHELRCQGVAILLISSDMEEIVELCDRAAVMVQGKIKKVFVGAEIELDRLISAAYGVVPQVGGAHV